MFVYSKYALPTKFNNSLYGDNCHHSYKTISRDSFAKINFRRVRVGQYFWRLHVP